MQQPFLPEIHWSLLQHPQLLATKTELWLCQLRPPVPQIAGNKWLKLHSALTQRVAGQGILSLGGAFSNHLAALAAAGQHYGFPTVGLVRTEQLDHNNPTLRQCRAHGMQLYAINRTTFRQRDTAEFNQYLVNQYPNYLIVPEGGSDREGATGVTALPLANTPAGTADLLCSATASGGTLAGIIQRYPDKKVLGLAVVKDKSLPERVLRCLPTAHTYLNWHIAASPSPYGQVTTDLIEFCIALKPQVSVEPIYTGKALQLLFSQLHSGEIAPGQRIAFFHTGGLQGLAGLHYRKIIDVRQYQQLTVNLN